MGKKQYELRILPLFEEKLNETVLYISEHLKNPIAANNFIDAVEAAIYERLQAPADQGIKKEKRVTSAPCWWTARKSRMRPGPWWTVPSASPG
jgi:hypothetical protein